SVSRSHCSIATCSKATNRFFCEVCHQGFQRDQNLQLHMRVHNLPWKLEVKPRSEVIRKKVYMCPIPTCIHHKPAWPLRDLAGIKKHFLRKHSVKTWQCDKRSKMYVVQSDCNAHSKTCCRRCTRDFEFKCGFLLCRLVLRPFLGLRTPISNLFRIMNRDSLTHM
ncbi:hypothetical protein Dsin_028939, partial [Dipteronia sinensis]